MQNLLEQFPRTKFADVPEEIWTIAVSVNTSSEKSDYTIAERRLIKEVAVTLDMRIWRATQSSTSDPRNQFRPVAPSDLYEDSFMMTSCKHNRVEVVAVEKMDKFGRKFVSIDECNCEDVDAILDDAVFESE